MLMQSAVDRIKAEDAQAEAARLKDAETDKVTRAKAGADKALAQRIASTKTFVESA